MTRRTIELLTPSVPNFIQTSVDKHMISVGDLTEDEITSLAQLWHDAMLEIVRVLKRIMIMTDGNL